MSTLQFILDRFQDAEARSPIRLSIGRNALAALFCELGYARGAEIGVERGEYAEVLCRANPDLTLLVVDPWLAYKGYREHVTQDKLEAFYAEARERLFRYKVGIYRATSMVVVNQVPDASLDFVYIDANHDFLHVTQDICSWLPKIRKGGILAGHDFRRVKGRYINHVKDVVQAFAYSHNITPWFVCAADSAPSWFWVIE